MKKLLIAFLSLIMLFCTAFAFACGGDDNGDNNQGGQNGNQNQDTPASHPDFDFKLTDDGTSYALIGHKANFNSTTFEIPSTFDGKPVTEIHNGYYKKQLFTDVIIPDSVVKIDRGAFTNCSELTNVTMGANVKVIGTNGFSSCPKLTSITLPNGLEEIGQQAFSASGLAEITIPGSVKRVGIYAFRSCPNLTTAKFLDGVEKIEDQVFQYCSNLANVTLGDGLKYMGKDVFSGTAYMNNALNYTNGALYLNDVLVKVKSADETLVIKNGTRVLADRSIPDYSMQTIELPKSLEFYCNEAIVAYYTLKQINVPSDNEFFTTIDGNLYTKDGKTLIRFCGGNTTNDSVYQVPTGVTAIANGAFKGCKFNTLTVANDVTTLGNGVFSEAKIKNLVIGEKVTTIGSEGVSNISSLETFTYLGTVEAWNAIEKDEKFYSYNWVDFIQCSNGNVVNPNKASAE